MYVTKFRSRPPEAVSAVQVEPLVVEVTNWPPAYGFESGLQLHVNATVPLEKADASRNTNA
jgi:hypothetical protein